MTLRQYAAIKLRIPDSGTDWLDRMILKSKRDDLAAQAATRSDTVARQLWLGRSSMLARVQYVAPGATGIRWRESEDRLYFIVPGVGLVQSLTPAEFVRYFSGVAAAEDLAPLLARSIQSTYAIAEGWGWTLQ
jgi:hypothetical protein